MRHLVHDTQLCESACGALEAGKKMARTQRRGQAVVQVKAVPMRVERLAVYTDHVNLFKNDTVTI